MARYIQSEPSQFVVTSVSVEAEAGKRIIYKVDGKEVTREEYEAAKPLVGVPREEKRGNASSNP